MTRSELTRGLLDVHHRAQRAESALSVAEGERDEARAALAAEKAAIAAALHRESQRLFRVSDVIARERARVAALRTALETALALAESVAADHVCFDEGLDPPHEDSDPGDCWHCYGTAVAKTIGDALLAATPSTEGGT